MGEAGSWAVRERITMSCVFIDFVFLRVFYFIDFICEIREDVGG